MNSTGCSILTCLLLPMYLLGCSNEQEAVTPAAMSVTAVLGGQESDGFARADRPRPFIFPEDHGAHPDYKHEWWYFTGNLRSDTDRDFGYQFTLFRSAIATSAPGSASAWATNQLYMAHVALSDLTAGTFHHDEQFGRGALGLAGVDISPYRLWLGTWSVRGVEVNEQGTFTLFMEAETEGFSLAFTLESTQSPVLHGEQGLSAKGPAPGNASYYYSYPRMVTRGEIHLANEVYRVSGESWFDHEWSTSSLSADQSGWDWFSLQLSNQTELMLFQLRNRDDPARNYVYGSYIKEGGELETLGQEDLVLQPISRWQSPETEVVYPSGWLIDIPGKGMHLAVKPRMPDQEMNTSFRYWEGAVSVEGRVNGNDIHGLGYAELTGYQ